MPPITTDEERMNSVAGGDPGAVEELFERYHRDLYGFFRRAGHPGDAAEDLVQDVFLRILKYARGFRPEGSFRGWLYRIARNAAADLSRRTSRFEPLRPAEPLPDEPADPVPAADVERLSASLARLSAEDRDVLVLARWQGLSGAELAAALDCSAGAARVRLHRALARLRALYLETPEENRHAMRRVD